VARATAAGASYIIPGFGMTLRDRQRATYYAQLDRLFPGLREQYETRFGDRYSAAANDAKKLERLFAELCGHHGIATCMKHYRMAEPAKQLSRF
jgi:hypothetical protein